MKINLSDADIKLLNELRINKPDSYKRKLRILGMTDEEVSKVSTFNYTSSYRSPCVNVSQSSYSYDPYKYSWEWTDDDYEQIEDYEQVEDYKYEFESKDNQTHNLYLIDGDNHITEALERINLADETDDVRIFVSQETLRKKLIAKGYSYDQVKLVTPGNQAVDNQIKSVLGNAVKDNYYTGIYTGIFVISHDKGYDRILQEYRSKYKIRKKHLDRREKL